jgi:hypothetical protein
MTVDSGAPVHGRDVFKTGSACETPGTSGPGDFNAMGDLVSRTRQRPTTSGIDHRLVRENFRHLTPSDTLLELELAFTRRAQLYGRLDPGKRQTYSCRRNHWPFRSLSAGKRRWSHKMTHPVTLWASTPPLLPHTRCAHRVRKTSVTPAVCVAVRSALLQAAGGSGAAKWSDAHRRWPTAVERRPCFPPHHSRHRKAL